MKKPTSAIHKSPASVLSNARTSRKTFDRLWNAAVKAPIFTKATTRVGKDGKKKVMLRTTRLIGSHAYKIAQSGAAANAAAVFAEHCGVLKLDAAKESTRAPWLPQMSVGARLLLEQFLAAVTQEATAKAEAFREGIGKRQRVGAVEMQLGWQNAKESIFGNTTLAPAVVALAPPPIVKTKPAAKKTKSKSGAAALGSIDDVTTGA